MARKPLFSVVTGGQIFNLHTRGAQAVNAVLMGQARFTRNTKIKGVACFKTQLKGQQTWESLETTQHSVAVITAL
jgi:hypothetical protein